MDMCLSADAIAVCRTVPSTPC